MQMIKLYELEQFSKEDLLEIINQAITKIDRFRLELDGNECDERDWKDISCDAQFILGELVEMFNEHKALNMDSFDPLSKKAVQWCNHDPRSTYKT